MAPRKPAKATHEPRATLTPKQRLAVELLAGGQTVIATASHPSIDVDRGTVREWRALPHFRAALDAAIDDIASEARDRTKASMSDVVETWRGILLDDEADNKDRIRAGEALADRGGLVPVKGVELTGKDGGAVAVDIDHARALFRAALELTPEQRAAVRSNGDPS